MDEPWLTVWPAHHLGIAVEPDHPSIACDYSMLGMPKEGAAALTKSINNGFGHWKWIENDTTLDNLRSEPGFQELLARRPPQ